MRDKYDIQIDFLNRRLGITTFHSELQYELVKLPSSDWQKIQELISRARNRAEARIDEEEKLNLNQVTA